MIPVTVLLQVIFAIQHTFAACPESLEGLTKWSELTTVGLELNMFDKIILINKYVLPYLNVKSTSCSHENRNDHFRRYLLAVIYKLRNPSY